MFPQPTPHRALSRLVSQVCDNAFAALNTIMRLKKTHWIPLHHPKSSHNTATVEVGLPLMGFRCAEIITLRLAPRRKKKVCTDISVLSISLSATIYATSKWALPLSILTLFREFMQAVKWAGDVVDNEHLNKRSSKSKSPAPQHCAMLLSPCCILHCSHLRCTQCIGTLRNTLMVCCTSCCCMLWTSVCLHGQQCLRHCAECCIFHKQQPFGEWSDDESEMPCRDS